MSLATSSSSKPSLKLFGKTASRYRIESATDAFGPWQPAAELALPASEWTWQGIPLNGAARQFYRAVEVSAPGQVEYVPNFRLLDLMGKSRDLYYHTHLKGVALVAAGQRLDELVPFLKELNELHRAGQTNGVELWLLLSDTTTPRADLAQQAQMMGLEPPILVDREAIIVPALKLTRVGESLVARTAGFSAAYRGAIGEGSQRLLSEAIQAVSSGQSPLVAYVQAPGAMLPANDPESVAYAPDIAPALRQYCARCHRPNDVAPFAMTNYTVVRNWAPAIQNALLTGIMAPWHADKEYGQFANDRSVPAGVKQKLLSWIRRGAPRGGGADPLTEVSGNDPAASWPPELGEPDEIVTAPLQEVPATADQEIYRFVHVTTPNTGPVWLRAAIVLPSNRSVAHHYSVNLGLLDASNEAGFAIYVPGASPFKYPAGSGVKLEAQQPLTFELHYAPNGQVTTDQPRLGLWYHQDQPTQTYENFAFDDRAFTVPPNTREHVVTNTWTATRSLTLHRMAPHLHLRGTSMRLEAFYPNGQREVLLSVVNYDPGWQTNYELATPKVLPAGTRLEVRGVWDNSPQNYRNPDPHTAVGWGGNSYDEMFIVGLGCTY